MNLWHTKGFKWKIILSVLVFLLGLVCSTVFSVRMHQNALEARRKTAQLNATTYANYLIEDFSQAIGVTYALEQILISEDGQCKRFETVAQNLSSSVLQSIQLAPNGIVTDIYPAAGNEDGKIDLCAECNPLHGPRVRALIEQLARGETPEKLSYMPEALFTADTLTAELLESRVY